MGSADIPPSPTGRPPIADVAGEAATTSAFNEMEQILREAREQGLLIQKLPIDAIDERYLVRDRVATDPDETRALMESLQVRGQQTPIEVTDLGGGRYGLISGWRRLNALRELQDHGGIDTVLAILRQPAEASDAYLAMVEENEIRVGLSYYERARIAVKATDIGVYPSDAEALKALFPTAPRSRRSKIGSFTRIVRALDEALQFPSSIGEKLGLALAKSLDVYPALAPALTQALQTNPPRIAAEEAGLIERVTQDIAQSAPAQASDPAKGGRPAKAPPEEINLGGGLTALVYAEGKIVLTGPSLVHKSGQDSVLDRLRD